MCKPLIKDIPSIKKILEDTKNIVTLRQSMPFLRPFLEALGVNVDEINSMLADSDVDELIRQAQEFTNIPDRFNSIFAERGWIIYDLMNLEVAKTAIEKAETGDLDQAEAYLVDYYNVETVRWKLQTMNGVEAFRLRMPLAQKALEDYEQERYHACIPVVLALLDGLVQELQQKGFFSKGVNLEAWDSIAAHSQGLMALNNIFTKGRHKTTTEQITIPYRNGILHGIDLGYDNKTVAVKTWAALFATRDWAIKAEKGLLIAPPEETEKTWGELLQQLKENEDDNKKLEQWKPRNIEIGIDIPQTGEPELFADGTPERRLAEYLKYWKLKNHGYMTHYISPMLSVPDKKKIPWIRDVYGFEILESFIFIAINDEAPAISDIQTELVLQKQDKKVKKLANFRMVNAGSDDNIAVRGKPNSEWFIMKWDIPHN